MVDRRVAAVREHLGASYGMYTAYRPTLAPALFAVQGAVDATRAGEALAAARGAIDELRRGQDFLEDFVRARATVLGTLVGMSNDSRTLAVRLSHAQTFGLPADFYDRLAGEVARLGPREVLELARRELDPASEVDVCEGARPALTKMFADVAMKAKIVDMAH